MTSPSPSKTLSLKDGRQVTCRLVRSGDEAELRRFNEALGERSRLLFSPHAYDDATLAKVVARSETHRDRIYIVLDGESIVAYFFLWWFDSPFPVLGIGIADAYQHQGLGRQLMRILLDDAEAAGCEGVELTTALNNKPAQALYESMGFTYLGAVDNISGDGRIIREHHMLCPIKPGATPPPRKHEPPV